MFVAGHSSNHFHGALHRDTLLVDENVMYIHLHTSQSATLWLLLFLSRSLSVACWSSKISLLIVVSQFLNISGVSCDDKMVPALEGCHVSSKLS